jgi:hypothetical protein
MKLTLLFSALAFAGLTMASARAEEGTAAERAACRPDVRKLCSDLGKGADEGQYKQCLQYHFGELSPKCAQVMTAHQMH